MKESIASGLIIIFLFSLCFITAGITVNFCTVLQKNTAECVTSIKSEDWNNSDLILQRTQEIFDKKAPLLKTFCIHKDINDIQNALSSLRIAISTQNKGECLLRANVLFSSLDILLNSDHFNIENIL